MGQTCSYILVQPGDGCASLAARCSITGAQFTEYNPSSTLCSTLKPGQPPNADGTCATYNVVPGDTCWDIADKNYITGWQGYAGLQEGPICISTGDPPMPAAVEGTVCGPQVPGSTRPSSWDQISSLNLCPLNACCNKWGQCGITPEFYTPSQSSTGAPGTSAPGQNGCISNCGTDIVNNGSPGGSIRISYFEAFGVNRACLTMDASAIPSGYTHMHYAFGGLSADYQVDLSKQITQWQRFAAITGFNRILSFGGWSFSTNVDSYPIFQDGVTEANRLRFAQSVVETVKQYNLDSIDFDWETVQSLLPAGYLKGFPIAEMAEILDYIVYMTYDLHGQWDYNNTWANPGYALGNCLRSHINLTETEYTLSMITKAGVPASKIAVLIAGYGRSFGMAELDSLVSGGPTTSKLACRGAITTWYDSDSDSDIMTYGGGTWVSYMSHATKQSRISRYASYSFAGSVEWAVDLVQFVLGQDEQSPGLSVAQVESEFTDALSLSSYDTSQFADYNFTDLATRLIGWTGCNGAQRRAIYSGWQQSWKIINLMYNEAKNGMDLNSAAAVEYLGPPSSSEAIRSSFESIFKKYATIQPGYLSTPNKCPCGVPSTTVAYTRLKDPLFNDAQSINFCPLYFSEPTLDIAMQHADKAHSIPDIYADLSNYYPNQGRTWYHELMHIDWATGAAPHGQPGLIRHITDLILGFWVPADGGGYKWDYASAYGADNAKALARTYIGSPNVIRNADSLTLYALARYVQKALGNIYLHLPLAGDPPRRVREKFEVSGYFTVEDNGTAAGWAASGADDTYSGVSDVGGDRGDDDAVVSLTTGFAAQTDYPADYLSSYSSTTKQCLQLRGGLPQTSTTDAPTCRWFTNSGGSWQIRKGSCSIDGCYNSDGNFDTEVWTAVNCGALDIDEDARTAIAAFEVGSSNGTATTAVTLSIRTVTRTRTPQASATVDYA
ncbi:glycoside hydrolase [Parachaetomium inaequale]|uniref:chitinase n=1 Tax=Parachaetomium inaequale TaxID=2588326 RepID=A0AAN6SKZ5_9PEZI|nr:glycoside hydrolase [Parachaetomium inaequale]